MTSTSDTSLYLNSCFTIQVTSRSHQDQLSVHSKHCWDFCWISICTHLHWQTVCVYLLNAHDDCLTNTCTWQHLHSVSIPCNLSLEEQIYFYRQSGFMLFIFDLHQCSLVFWLQNHCCIQLNMMVSFKDWKYFFQTKYFGGELKWCNTLNQMLWNYQPPMWLDRNYDKYYKKVFISDISCIYNKSYKGKWEIMRRQIFLTHN